MHIRTFRIWYLVHKWTSLVCTIFLLLLCLTGLPLVFGHEIDHWFGNGVEAPEMPADTARMPVDRIVADALERRPGSAVRFVTADDEEPVWFVSLSSRESPRQGGALLTYDARTGHLLRDTPLRSGFMLIMVKLHTDLFAGLPGTLFLGFMGLLFVVSIVSGVVVYGPLMKKLPFGTVRRERSPRLKWLDLHNVLGMATLSWLTVVGITGVLLTLAKPTYSIWQSTELKAMVAPFVGQGAPRALSSLDKAIGLAQAEEPHMTTAFVAFPGTPLAGPRHYAVFMRGDAHITSRLIKPVLVDAETGQFAAKRDMPWYVAALRISGPLHFGDYGAMPLKVLWAVLDVIAIVLLGSGLYLWIGRTRQMQTRLRDIEASHRAPAVAEAAR
ncbi:PepSY-associated TM helix domain-containing protein [Cupriavidus plantarum]|uniref:PepSY-associated TM helix domain-containing protein n=1 Tax=Cupriavidus plantarum TaxID=942865 RepID=UPI0015CCBFE4|nr:PepSY domain-containing protein [Cupriavidus plantarum]NYI02653.1 putative iron-regulated membrane protein [Cupriavidus plantarum]